MTTYIALLRGVNVGGNNKINMKELAAACREAGLENVQTYINSGNIVFNSANTAGEVRAAIELLINRRFGLNITAAVYSAAELADALAQAPAWWGSTKDAKHNAIFVLAPTTAEEVCAEVGETKPEYESVAYHGQLIFWTAPLATFSMTRWGSVAKRKTYQKITIRNANTAKKLLELAVAAAPAAAAAQASAAAATAPARPPDDAL